MSDPALQLLLFHLRLLKRTVAGVGGAAAGADLQTSGRNESPKVSPFKVIRQIVQPRWHYVTDILEKRFPVWYLLAVWPHWAGQSTAVVFRWTPSTCFCHLSLRSNPYISYYIFIYLYSEFWIILVSNNQSYFAAKLALVLIPRVLGPHVIPQCKTISFHFHFTFSALQKFSWYSEKILERNYFAYVQRLRVLHLAPLLLPQWHVNLILLSRTLIASKGKCQTLKSVEWKQKKS